MEVRIDGGNARATVRLHVRAGEGPEGVAGSAQEGFVQTDVTPGLYQ